MQLLRCRILFKRIIKVVGIVIIPIGILLFMSQMRVSGTTFSNAIVSTVAGVIGMIPEGLVLLTSVFLCTWCRTTGEKKTCPCSGDGGD